VGMPPVLGGEKKKRKEKKGSSGVSEKPESRFWKL